MIYNAISIKQPWADAIIECGKNIENRTWKCPAKFQNRTILIHAGKRLDLDANFIFYPELRDIFMNGTVTGGIVGAFSITSGDLFNLNNRWADALCFNWEIANARRVNFFPCKGSLGFFKVDYPHHVPEVA